MKHGSEKFGSDQDILWTMRCGREDDLPFNNIMEEKNLVCGGPFLFPDLSFTSDFIPEKDVLQVNTVYVLTPQMPRTGCRFYWELL